MIINDFLYRKYLSSAFVPFDEESKLLPVRLKNRYVAQDEYFDFDKNAWQPLIEDTKTKDYAAEFVELPFLPKKLFNQESGFDDSNDLDAQEMEKYLTARYYQKHFEFNKKNFYDQNNIGKDYVKAKITTDTESLTLKITFTKFARKKEESHYETEVPAFEDKILFFDMKNGIVDFNAFTDLFSEDKEYQCEKIESLLPYSVIAKAFERLLELAEQFTGVSFAQYREQMNNQKIALYEFFKITMLPMCPNLYDIINHKQIKDRHVHFRYKRTDSKIFKRFCRKYKIRNTKVLRKCFIERPEVLITFLHLKDCGFRDMNLYNRVITNEDNCIKLRQSNPKDLAFFCHYSIKNRGQKATMNTILRNTSNYEELNLNDYFRDGLDMFAKYFKHIPETLKTDILTEGFTKFNHDALANLAYRYENKNITFTYTAEQKKLEDDIDGYSFRLPENSYQLCEIGTSLHNCVASYATSVKKKICTIVYATKNGNYEICIEVRGNEVWQERMDHNQDPGKEQEALLAKWREKHNLRLK